MKEITIQGQMGKSTIVVGETLQNLKKYLPTGKTVVVTDTNVWHHYQNDLDPFDVIQIGTGEKVKTLDTVRFLYERLIEMKADRSTFVAGVGGGIVCDITGFVGSTYLRGVPYGFVGTTLLSQVDASVGGKNGVNFRGYKNMVGVFNQPRFVICDIHLLNTLPVKEIQCGLSEVVKHAAITDAGLFSYLEKNASRAVSLDPEVTEKLVYDSVMIKSQIVNRDEREGGERRKLNFGHTLGHAIEKTTSVSHGEAVSAGMVLASKLSLEKGLLSEDDVNRMTALLIALGLPVSIQAEKAKLMEVIQKDKKREGDLIRFVLLERLGSAVVKALPISELQKFIGESEDFDCIR